MRFRSVLAIPALFLLTLAVPAFAHPSADHSTGIASGAAHPFSGLDHLLAMIAVGLIAAKLGGRSIWLLPVLFVAGMVVGGAIAMVTGGTPIGGIEQAIAASVIVFGLLLVAMDRIPASISLLAVPLFALFHGYAHLAEGAGSQSVGAIGYGLGMVAATSTLHLLGVAGGLLVRNRVPVQTWRLAGSALSAVGVVLLLQTL